MCHALKAQFDNSLFFFFGGYGFVFRTVSTVYPIHLPVSSVVVLGVMECIHLRMLQVIEGVQFYGCVMIPNWVTQGGEVIGNP